MDPFTQTIVSVILAVFASSGFWTYLMKRNDKNDNRTKMLIGLGHDRIMSLGTKYIARGYITPDEYENMYEYLYKPYKDMGGNGSAERIMDAVKKLPIKEHVPENV